jgi:hypothetical protein
MFFHLVHYRTVYAYNNKQTVKMSSTKKKLILSRCQKDFLFIEEYISERSLLLVFCSQLLTKFIDSDPDPH